MLRRKLLTSPFTDDETKSQKSSNLHKITFQIPAPFNYPKVFYILSILISGISIAWKRNSDVGNYEAKTL